MYYQWREGAPRGSGLSRTGYEMGGGGYHNNNRQFNTYRTSGPSYQRRERYSTSPGAPVPHTSYRARSAPPSGGYMSRSAPSGGSGFMSQSTHFKIHQPVVPGRFCASTSPFHQGPPHNRHRSSSNQNVSVPVYSSQSGWPAVTNLSGGGRRHSNNYHHRSHSSVVNFEYEPC